MVCVYFFSGSCYGGHYHAYIRDMEGLRTWFEPVRRIFQTIFHSPWRIMQIEAIVIGG